jgi:hypothetical protein
MGPSGISTNSSTSSNVWCDPNIPGDFCTITANGYKWYNNSIIGTSSPIMSIGNQGNLTVGSITVTQQPYGLVTTKIVPIINGQQPPLLKLRSDIYEFPLNNIWTTDSSGIEPNNPIKPTLTGITFSNGQFTIPSDGMYYIDASVPMQLDLYVSPQTAEIQSKLFQEIRSLNIKVDDFIVSQKFENPFNLLGASYARFTVGNNTMLHLKTGQKVSIELQRGSQLTMTSTAYSFITPEGGGYFSVYKLS